jgi:preprotein translocase subunit SecA
MLQKLGLKEGEAIVHPWINKALEKAQKKVEARNFDTRKNLLKYDNVMNDQRREVYAQRREFMKAKDVAATVAEMRHEVIADAVAKHIPEHAMPEQWDAAGLRDEIVRLFNLDLPVEDWAKEEGIDEADIRERIERAADSLMAKKTADFGPDLMRQIEKSVLLQMLDQVWKEHLLMLDHLRQGIGLRAYGQRDPLNEYKNEAFNLFNTMLQNLRERVTSLMARVELAPPPPPEPVYVANATGAGMEPVEGNGGGTALLTRPARARQAQVDPSDPSTWHHTPRNAPCPCGSGKKYKHCHGRV